MLVNSTGSTEPGQEKLPKRFVRPQVLRNLTNEQRGGANLDLCFVAAVPALARGLHDGPNLGGMLCFLGLFVPVWWSWMIFTWYATAFDNDDVPYRVTLFVAMLSILGLATSVGGSAQSRRKVSGLVCS